MRVPCMFQHSALGRLPGRRPNVVGPMYSSCSTFSPLDAEHLVAQFMDASSFIDSDNDGIINKNDIRATFDTLGRLCTDKEFADMTSESPEPIKFTTFLTIFGKRAQGNDDEDVIANAFYMYDEGEGMCKDDTLKHALCTWGEKISPKEVGEVFAEVSVLEKLIE